VTLQDWKTLSVNLSRLRDLAERPGWGVAYPAFEFLKEIGAVPAYVTTMPNEKVRLGLNPGHIPAGYLASAAYEWDTWGPSHPTDFVDMLEAELNPEKREFISTLLTSLGRSIA
jgi:hypothetical protein